MTDVSNGQAGVAKALEVATLSVAVAAEHAVHRFVPVTYKGKDWDLSHLDPFAFHHEVFLDKKSEQHLTVEIVIIFSCHCFTHDIKHDSRSPIPAEELFVTAEEVRVLNETRYKLSQTILLALIKSLPSRKIIVAAPGDNYVTFERESATGVEYYSVFFEATKAKSRRNRVILRVQSAYMREPTKRERQAKKVGFDTLLKAALEGRKIRP